MKISLRWLNDYIDVREDFTKPEQLAALLTSAGIEVEGIQNLAKAFDHVVVGNILQKARHPNSDRLTLCQVSTGDGVVHQIVCGARNHKEGDRVVVALPGAVLPGNFAIKRSKIRDVESGGMRCSEKELGLKTESEGIFILPADATVGQPFAKYMGLDDILLELKVTPNRSDCLSHFGLAREIGTLRGIDAKFPSDVFEEDGGSTRGQVVLELRESHLCPRYAGRGVSGVKVGPSPLWLKKRLEGIGIKSINNVVDVTNYVMMVLGQPLHAFDVRELKGRKVIVDRATAGESFTTLDGTEIKFDGSELTIRDSERAVALAGVVGGKNSGIADDTAEIFIESAHFSPGGVRRTARKFGIETDSSYRFSRGTNPDAVWLALNRAAFLIQQVAGGKIMSEAYDYYPNPIRREPIDISLHTVEERLGYPVSLDEFKQWMRRIGCVIEPLHEGPQEVSWRILPPVFRWDLAVDMDLVEEYARLHGYQHIPETLPPLAVSPSPHALEFVLESKIRRLLQGDGCLQAVNYGFINESFQNHILGDVEKMKVSGLDVAVQAIRLVNPLNEELGVMRTSLIPGLLKNMQHNSRQGNAFGRLFELGSGHARGTGEKRYTEQTRLGFALWGAPEDLWWNSKNVPVALSLKTVVENLLLGLGIRKWRWQTLSMIDTPEFLHPSQSAQLEFEGKPVGFIGALHPSLAEELKIREPAALGEFNLERLLAGQPRHPHYSAISKMPAIERDIALLMPKDLPAATVEAEIRKTAGDLLKSLNIFDVFEGEGVAPGQKSVAFRMRFQAGDTTLEDEKVNELRDKIVNALGQKWHVTLRQ